VILKFTSLDAPRGELTFAALHRRACARGRLVDQTSAAVLVPNESAKNQAGLGVTIDIDGTAFLQCTFRADAGVAQRCRAASV
jgi:hypothetical protein